METIELSTFLKELFHHVVGQNGCQIDISTVLPEYKLVFLDETKYVGTEFPVNKHYEFFGGAAFQLAITACIRKRFSQLNQNILKQMRTLIMSSHGLLKMIGDQCNINKYIDTRTSNKTATAVMEGLLGVTQEFFGLEAVISFILPYLDEFTPRLFRPLPRQLRARLGLIDTPKVQPNLCAESGTHTYDTATRNMEIANSQGSVYRFNSILTSQGGQMKTHYTQLTASNGTIRWSIELMFQLTTGSAWYSHVRTGSSKKQARALAIQDIIDYYDVHPDEVRRHSMPAITTLAPKDAERLPIEVMEDCEHVQDTNEHMDHNHHETADSYLHVPEKRHRQDDGVGGVFEDEEAYLMRMLLSNFSRLDTTDVERKDCDDTSNKRHRYNPDVSSPISPPVTPAPSAHGTPEDNLQIMRRKIDITRIERIWADPVQRANPKSSIFSYVHNLKDMSIKTTFEESGPSHQRTFIATTTLLSEPHKLVTVGRGSKKSEAEMSALLALLQMLLNG